MWSPPLAIPYVLMATGMIVGESLFGVLYAGIVVATGDEQRAAEAVFVGSEQRCEHHVAAALETAVDAQFHARTQPVGEQGVMRFDQTHFPGQARVFDRR